MAAIDGGRCGVSASVEFETFRRALVAALCEPGPTCASALVYGPRCAEWMHWASTLQPTATFVGEDEILGRVARGEVAVDPVMAAACLERVRSCRRGATRFDPCERLLQGTCGPTSACTTSGDCASNETCFVAFWEECAYDRRCVADVARPCDADYRCPRATRPGFATVCDDGTCRELPERSAGAGEPCSIGIGGVFAVCDAPGMGCVDNVCLPVAAPLGSCVDAACPPGQVCDAGSCRPSSMLGPYDLDRPCGFCPLDLSCIGGRCTAPTGDIGSPCTETSCDPGLWCGPGGTCVPGEEGDPCFGCWQCQSRSCSAEAMSSVGVCLRE